MQQAGSLPAAMLFPRIDFGQGAVAAISGGSDSTALLVLLKNHFDRFLPSARLIAVTVDHALRSASATEAQTVAGLCEKLGIVHRTVAWEGAKPSSGIPAAAREARYRLLADVARDEGLDIVVTGHTADDQAETVIMRQARDEGPGLAGMAPATLYEGDVWILRPLLAERRSTLRALLTARGLGWIDDPTNLDPAFERPRARATLAGNENQFEDILATACRVAHDREELSHRAAILIDRHGRRLAPGLIRLAPEFGAETDRPAALQAMRVLLAVTGGTSFLPDKDRVAGLLRMSSAGTGRATLSRTVIDVRRAGIFLYREARGLPVPSMPSDGAVWDGRYRITFDDGVEGCVIAPFGREGGLESTASAGEEAPASLFRAAHAVEPAVWRDGIRLGSPGEPGRLPGAQVVPVVAPFARFLSGFDLEVARAVSGLVGAPSLPAPPLKVPAGSQASANA
ncbi:tRNA lysidine(34) synthetase TilS [Mesorhizobium sp. UC22_110]|uniref:tRNA lysidine(34) synthetase TilS n=1 Tax=unclassified Mesorhizobium TaxID=325217 RepID=UPI00366D2C1B